MAKAYLSKEEIKHRLLRLRNLERLHKEQKQRINHLTAENKQLKERVLFLEKENKELKEIIQNFKLQIEELKIMVFGKKKKKDNDDNDDISSPPKEKITRTSDSYKRPIPKDEEITKLKYHLLDVCACGSKTTKKKEIVFYEEDIPIPVNKTVIKHIVRKSYCPMCKKWKTEIPLPSNKVILGPNVKKYICYLSVICRLSFTQIQNILKDTYNINISQGEISNILEKETLKLRPFYEQLKERIRGEPVIYLDETSRNVFMGDGITSYSWVMSGAESKESFSGW